MEDYQSYQFDEEKTVARPFHAKRSHRKSRLGCVSCKKRKVKCDEVRPVCKACGLRNTKCEWPDDVAVVKFTNNQRQPANQRSQPYPISPASSFEASPSSSSCTSMVPVRVINEPMACLPSTNQQDMKLLWFYTVNTSYSFVNDEPSMFYFGNGLQTAVVQEALDNPFLMKSLFALSSQHMKQLGQEIDSSRLLMDRAQAYQGYREAIVAAQPKTFSALLANSLLLELLSAETFRDPNAPDLYVLDWVMLWRGIKSIVEITDGKNSIVPGIRGLFYRPPTDLKSASKAVPGTLLTFVTQLSPDQDDYIHSSTYLSTLVFLSSLYDNLAPGFDASMGLRIVTWFTIVPKEFVTLMREKKPMALVIVAYYGVFLKLMNDYWWVRGVGERIIKDIVKYLGPAWYHMLSVPLQACATEDQAEISRILLSDNWTDTGIVPQSDD